MRGGEGRGDTTTRGGARHLREQRQRDEQVERAARREVEEDRRVAQDVQRRLAVGLGARLEGPHQAGDQQQEEVDDELHDAAPARAELRDLLLGIRVKFLINAAQNFVEGRDAVRRARADDGEQHADDGRRHEQPRAERRVERQLMQHGRPAGQPLLQAARLGGRRVGEALEQRLDGAVVPRQQGGYKHLVGGVEAPGRGRGTTSAARAAR